ncbi:ventrally expressed dharma/bozozok antagonist [Notolabrus celidotus]|uniref:ventrally expressed dharma/bozozok antagonist n=1 Tax=Notolabrus celidotus TaxID=1203425 RepID=UPI0014907C35|nr:ventrally expressed dharma/bozozok antagonist [Notolabrus celidotus]
MRGRFSIEWMAQSSQPAGTETQGSGSGSGPVTCGTNAESLPGFYCRQRSEVLPEQEIRSHEDEFSSTQHTNPQSNPVSEAGFSSGTEEETSGYESEGGHSISLSAPDADCTSSPSSPSSSSSSCPTSPPSGRRPRTAFTADQISSMERAFKRNAYLGTQDKAELCKKLNLSDKQIRNWFQNRRMKLKRTVQDALAHACQANVASQLMHYPELQAYRPGPYSRYHSAAGGQEGPAAASYIHPHSLQYGSALPSVPSLPLDSFYQYSSLPGVMLPSAAAPLMASYAAYPQYY